MGSATSERNVLDVKSRVLLLTLFSETSLMTLDPKLASNATKRIHIIKNQEVFIKIFKIYDISPLGL